MIHFFFHFATNFLNVNAIYFFIFLNFCYKLFIRNSYVDQACPTHSDAHAYSLRAEIRSKRIA